MVNSKKETGSVWGRTMFRTVKRKRCKRCGGNLCLEYDEYGVYLCCIQCSASYDESDAGVAECSTSGFSGRGFGLFPSVVPLGKVGQESVK